MWQLNSAGCVFPRGYGFSLYSLTSLSQMRSPARVRPDVLSVEQEGEKPKRQKLTDDVVGQLRTRLADAEAAGNSAEANLFALDLELVNARRDADRADLAVGELETRLAAAEAVDPSAEAAVGSYDDDMQAAVSAAGGWLPPRMLQSGSCTCNLELQASHSSHIGVAAC